MAIKNSAYIYINGINRTPNVVTPLKWGNLLDERLDEFQLSLRQIEKENFAPLTPVEIQLTNELYWGYDDRTTEELRTETKYYVVANDNAEETQIGSGLYNHDLYLLEATKSAECYVVDSLTFTNSLGRVYTENAPLATPIWE